MSEQVFKVNGIDICTESFGNPNNPKNIINYGSYVFNGLLG